MEVIYYLIELKLMGKNIVAFKLVLNGIGLKLNENC